MDRGTIVRVLGIVEETPTIKSFHFDYPPAKEAKPGQFVMVNVLGVDEIPMSLSSVGSTRTSITVRKVGDATARLHQLSVGDLLGIRGPYGRGFSGFDRGKALLVGGGVGTAPLLPLAKRLAEWGEVRFDVALGARTREELLFLDRMGAVGRGKVLAATDDGSYGKKGFVTVVTETLLRGKIDMVFTCGPERMIRDLFEQCRRIGIPLQASLDRYMRCGIGICGSCAIGGYRVCREGPVFNSDQLARVERELGRFRHDCCGKRVRI
ncbi:MAG: dihydroorotate dehydrogenase electron transfer subunit [Candidatus Bathyarchaeia archaeon]